jgi:thioredoxin reductase (NADPH)
MHQAALIGHALADAPNFGWQVGTDVQHNWEKMKDGIQEHIKSLNWSYKVQLKTKKVTYLNAYAKFDDAHHITATDAKGKEMKLSSKYFVLATGGRPRYPDIPGCKEFSITSDDLFSLPRCPGTTLVVGASYVALECAGFLRAFGLDVTVMVRSILLRGFDQQMAEKIGEYMQENGVKFQRPCVPTKIERVREEVEGQPAIYRVTGTNAEGEEIVGEYNTVLMAVGRDPCTAGLHLDKAGVRLNPKTGYVICGDDESTSAPSVYAVGDIIEGRPELTPVAIQAGRLLVRRLFAHEALKCDYTNVPTTVFTPLEYGCIGLAEEDAKAKYTADDIQVYHSSFTPLEWTVPHRESNACYAKLICVKSLNERVVGLHVLGPNAGEMTQGWTVGMKLHATKADFDNSIGIHPTCAEVFTTLTVTKSSGDDAAATGC